MGQAQVIKLGGCSHFIGNSQYEILRELIERDVNSLVWQTHSFILNGVDRQSFWSKFLVKASGQSFWSKFLVKVSGQSFWSKFLVKVSGQAENCWHLIEGAAGEEFDVKLRTIIILVLFRHD